MTNKIDNFDLNIVRSVEPVTVKSFNIMKLGGLVGSYAQHLIASERYYRVVGYLESPLQADVETLQNIGNHGQILLLDINDVSPAFIRYGKVDEFRWVLEEAEGNLWAYEFVFRDVPCIGTTQMNSSNAYLRARDFRANLRQFNPLGGRHTTMFDSTRRELTWEYYIANVSASTQTLYIEMMCGEKVSKFTLYGWKASAWNLIGDWGGADAWDALKSGWLDNDSVSHNFRASRGDRGETTSSGEISRSIGTRRRVIFSVTNMLSGSAGGHISTKYGTYQILLKAILNHPQPESARPHPLLYYVDGSLDDGAPQ